MELGWWNRDEDGRKYRVQLEKFGSKLIWRCQRGSCTTTGSIATIAGG